MGLVEWIEEVLTDVVGDMVIDGLTGFFPALTVARLLVARGYYPDEEGGEPSKRRQGEVRRSLITNRERFGLEARQKRNRVYFRSVVPTMTIKL